MTTLAELSARINSTSPVRPLVLAALVKLAGAEIRNPSATPERRTWASNVLGNPEACCEPRVMNVVLTNPTIGATLDAYDPETNTVLPSDSDIEYVVAAEVLPLVAPA